MIILTAGFENQVRMQLGVDDAELLDEELRDEIIVDLGEAEILARIPEYATIVTTAEATDLKVTPELLYLKKAIVCQIAANMCVGIDRRLNQEVSTLDIKWKKSKIDWAKKQEQLLCDVDKYLGKITSVDVSFDSDVSSTIASTIIRTRDPIGGLQS